MTTPLFTSTVIPTVGRLSLARAVTSVLQQEFHHDDFEIIVVNDSGESLPYEGWHACPRVRIIETKHRERSVARNTGAAVARGTYLHFLDDDDWLLPGALEALWQTARQRPDAGWVYGGVRLVDNDGEPLIEVFPDLPDNCFIQSIAWEFAPLQSSLIHSEAFFEAGGFAPLPLLLGGFEDVHLVRLVASRREFAAAPKVVAAKRTGEAGSTTKWTGLFAQNRQSRELAIDRPGSFSRLRNSARESPTRSAYWHGQMIYYYLASVKWNLAQRRLFKAISRSAFAGAGLFASGTHLLRSDFRRGLTKPYLNRIGAGLMSVNAGLHDVSKWSDTRQVST